MLKGFHALIALHKLAPTSLSLTSCAVLTEENLKPFLHAELTYLDLRGSSIPSIPIEIKALCPNLEELHFRGCPRLQYIENRRLFGLSPIVLPHLKVLNVARCPSLTSIRVNSCCIIDLKANNNPQLKMIKAPLLVPNITNSPKVKITAGFQPLGKNAWATHYGDIGEEPPLPPNIVQILNSPCPIWSDKKTYETHVLALIPATVNGQPFTLENLGKLIQNPRTGPATEYEFCDLGESQDAPIDQSYWTLMSRDVLKGSRRKDYETQFAQVEAFRQETGVAYTVPRVLEAATCILMHHVSTGQKIYGTSPLTYTRCKESFEKEKGWKLNVGGFSSGGLNIHDGNYIDEHGGVGVCRKL